MADISRTYTMCKGSYWQCEDPRIESIYTWGSPPVAMPWFILIPNGENDVFNFYFTTDEVGTFTIEFEGEDGNYGTITIIVSDCGTDYNNCTQESDQNIAWLNPLGGWQSYVFQGVSVDGYDAGKVSTYKSNGILKYSGRENVYQTIIANTDYVPKQHIDYIESLRFGAIQAYKWSDVTDSFSIPIILESVSFSKYGSHDQLYKATIKFRLATEIIIQGQ